MGFQPSNSLNAIPDVHTRAELKSLWLAFGSVQKSVSTLIRNNEAVVDYTPSSITLTAGSGLTGGGDLTADRTFAVGAGTGITVAADSVAVDQGFTPTWTGIHTFSAQDVHNAGVSLGTSGVLNSAKADAASAMSILMQPTVALTSGTDRWTHVMEDSAGNVRFSIASNGAVSLFSEGASLGGIVSVQGTAATSMSYGIFFAPTWSGAGTGIPGFANGVAGAAFTPTDASGATATTLVGGVFGTTSVYAPRTHSNIIGGIFSPVITWSSTGAIAHGNIYGWYVRPVPTAKSTTATAVYGGYVPPMLSGATPATTNAYGLYVDEQVQATNKYGAWLASATAGYKCLVLGATANWLAYESATTFSLNSTTVLCKADLDISAKNIVTDTSTGTKIGTGTTQKVGFYNTAPIAQYATTGTVTGYTGAGGTALTHSDTFTGNTGSTAYTIGDIVRALKLWGAIAA